MQVLRTTLHANMEKVQRFFHTSLPWSVELCAAKRQSPDVRYGARTLWANFGITEPELKQELLLLRAAARAAVHKEDKSLGTTLS